MSYSIYFIYGSKKYKFPVNPEEIKCTRELSVETYQVLKSGQVSIPAYCALEEFSFEAEFPSREYHYMESGARADADFYEKMFLRAQKNMKPIRFIASNGITDDISKKVLVISVEVVEKAGEEGDKYLSLKLLEYKGAGKRFVAVQMKQENVKQEQSVQPENPAVTENKSHIVKPDDTLWAIAKKYYGDGAQYTKLAAANPWIKNPNLIYPGQSISIPT